MFRASIDNVIVGYAFGHYYTKENKNSYIELGTKCFDVDEIYVLKEYRSLGIGRKLFSMLEEEVKGSVDFITLPTSTKDYKKILKFYVDNMGMDLL